MPRIFQNIEIKIGKWIFQQINDLEWRVIYHGHEFIIRWEGKGGLSCSEL